MNDDKQELIAWNLQIGRAELARDVKFLSSILADSLVFRRANGKVADKKTYLEELEKAENTYEYLQSDDLSVSLYERLAVVSLRVRAKGMRGKLAFEGVFRNIRIFLTDP